MHGRKVRQFRRTTCLLQFYLAVLIGIALAYFGLRAPWQLVAMTIPLLAIALKARTVFACLLIIMIGVLAGSWRGSIYYDQLNIYKVNYRQPVLLEVTAQEDAIYGRNSQLTFTGGKIKLNGRPLAGKVQVSGYGLPAVYQGDRIEVTGKLYPTRGALQGRISYAKLSLISKSTSLVGQVRRTFAAGLTTALPEPLASFSLGLLVGQRSTIPEQVKQDLMMVGLTHIVAVSGYNLTILLNASKHLLAKRSKRLNVLLAVMLMGSFLLITGGAASIVRAAIVSSLSIAAVYYGRHIKPVHLIVFAAFLTAWAKPFFMWSDMGWYLSFLAFYGILILAPQIKDKLPLRWQTSLIAGIAVESISAEIMTLPFVVHFFRQMSFAGLPANILVVTVVPFAMLFGFIAGLAGVFAAGVAGWIAVPANVVLNYMLDTAHLIAGVPNIFKENIKLTFIQMIGCYIFIFAFTLLLHRKTYHAKYGNITDKNQSHMQGAELERT